LRIGTAILLRLLGGFLIVRGLVVFLGVFTFAPLKLFLSILLFLFLTLLFVLAETVADIVFWSGVTTSKALLLLVFVVALMVVSSMATVLSFVLPTVQGRTC
jgi:hypothetical protein